MIVQFTDLGWAEYRHWIENDPKMLSKLTTLIEDVRRSPFRGLGKPEPLREDWSGWWSRRIDDEHRLVYRVTGKGAEQRIEIVRCRWHYCRPEPPSPPAVRWRQEAVMSAKQTPEQKKTVDRVMHEFKHHELETAGGRTVKNPKQAIAIALSEAGASNRQSPKENKQRLARTKRKEASGETAMQEAEGRGAKTRTELYAEARRRDVAGRSKMDKAELERALR